MKIMTTTTKMRRKIAILRDKLYGWLEQLSQKRKTVKVVKLLRKKYISTGEMDIKILYYELPFDAIPILEELREENLIKYTILDNHYMITIQLEEDEEIEICELQ